MSGTSTVHTIGHSTHELPAFVQLLNRHGVTAVADVRSQPRSRLEHFGWPALEVTRELRKTMFGAMQ